MIYLILCLVRGVRNFADDTTHYVSGKNLEFVLTKLENHSIISK